MNVCLPSLAYAGYPLNTVMHNSLVDLGHKIVKHSEADVVIAVGIFQGIENKHPDKKYILFQTEGYSSRRKRVEELYAFGPNEIWGFDIENKREEYTPLGYHPCLLFKSFLFEDIDVVFVGWQKKKRLAWLGKVRNKWIHLNTRVYFSGASDIFDFPDDDKLLGECISRSRIYLNISFSERTTITQWPRIAYPLANEQFVITDTYCPVDIPTFDSVKSYDKLVDFYLAHPEERKEKAKQMTKEYKANFDMRDILKGRGF